MYRSLAQQKLHLLVALSSAVAIARKCGCQGHTIRMLALGSVPRGETIEKLLALDISAQDWFTPADDAEAKLETDGAVGAGVESGVSAASRTLPLAFSSAHPSAASNG